MSNLNSKVINPLSQEFEGQIGIEVELPLHHGQTGLTSAIPLLPDNGKDNHVRIDKKGTYHHDNVLLEVTTDPHMDGGDIHDFVYDVLKSLGGYNLMCSPAVKYPESMLQHPTAKEAGCDPSLSIYGAFNPVEGFPDQYRYGGLHINIDFPTHDKSLVSQLVSNLDNTVGLLSVLRSQNPNGEALRRRVYGKAGEHRIKAFGVEYRVCSNSSFEYLNEVLSLAKAVAEATLAGDDIKTCTDIERIINECDQEAGAAWSKEVNSVLEYRGAL